MIKTYFQLYIPISLTLFIISTLIIKYKKSKYKYSEDEKNKLKKESISNLRSKLADIEDTVIELKFKKDGKEIANKKIGRTTKCVKILTTLVDDLENGDASKVEVFKVVIHLVPGFRFLPLYTAITMKR